MIKQYGLRPPFLDVGCGVGDVSRHLSSKGWSGKAIDISEIAIGETKQILYDVPRVEIEKKSLYEETRVFKTILALDILEHLEDDMVALQKIASLLSEEGHVVVAVPSNPREWRWDDDYFGHVRRYTVNEVKEKFGRASLKLIELWDFTYPVFWLMRRLYTKFKKCPEKVKHAVYTHEDYCPLLQAWEIPFISNALSKDNVLWRTLYKWQFEHFRHKLTSGHEMIVLAKKVS